jgi:ATP-binding cassette subfamily F protein 3
VFSDVRLTLHRGEKIGLVGPNGAGKTTLLKMLAGALAPDDGEVRLGANVRVGYFAQHTVEQLDLSRTILEEVRAEATDESRTELRSILGAFGFSGAEVDKKISVLSGGERARVALAKMLLQPAECLLLDEPTNHLDIASREMLEQAIKDHGGTACIISHDRYFLNATTNLIAHVHDGRVDTYSGNYEYFKYKMKEVEDAAAASEAASPEATQGPTSSKRELRKQLATLRTQRQRATAELREATSAAEQEVTRLEEEKARLEATLADPATYDDQEMLVDANRRYKSVLASLEDAEEVWMLAQEELDEADAVFEARERELRGEEG